MNEKSKCLHIYKHEVDEYLGKQELSMTHFVIDMRTTEVRIECTSKFDVPNNKDPPQNCYAFQE